MLTPIKLPPGIYQKGTAYQAKGRWRDANFVRWVDEVMQPVGGWQRLTNQQFTGRVSGLFSFEDRVTRKTIVVGTSSNVYAIESSNVYDITPTGFIVGRDVTTPGLGYGSGSYGASTYSTPRSGDTDLSLQAAHWSLDNWGTLLLGMTNEDGRLWYWDAGDLQTAPDDEMTLVANAPENNKGMVVTNERHVMLFGAGGDDKAIQWSDREDFETWTPVATNRAGDLRLQTRGSIQTGMKVGSDTLVLTDKDAFIVEYVGVPFFYGQRQVGTNCGILGPRAATAILDFAVWMAADGFYTYNGQVEPLPCDAWDWVYRELDTRQVALITSGHNEKFTEVWWFFPVRGGAEGEIPMRYVTWNYSTGVWSIGRLNRTHWTASGVWEYPLAASPDGRLYEHERDLGAGGLESRPKPYAETAPFDIQSGELVSYVTKLIPDRDSVAGDVLEYTFKTRFNPNSQERTYGPYSLDADGYVDVRFSGRQVVMRVTPKNDRDWRLGILRADVVNGGRR